MSSLLDQLNQQQKEAVIHQEGPAIVLAGAGSGKTKVLTTRVAWLIKERGLRPEEILLVTFTNKAADEMNRRVMEMTNYKLKFSGTFHSLCAKILRIDGQAIDLSPGFSIYDSSDQLVLVKQIYKQRDLDPKKLKPQAAKAIISQAKNELLTPRQYEDLVVDDRQKFASHVYHRYQQALEKQQAVDFDDLLMLVIKLFKKNQEILSKYQQQLTHVLVDEYQDTNKAQYHLTNYFAQPQNNLYVVGDFSQSIYAWRGADYRNLMRLKQDFEKMTEYRLERNYRSTQIILDAATKVISRNTTHPILKLWTDDSSSGKIEVYETANNDAEADQVALLVAQEHLHARYSDMAILYRTNAQSRAFEEAFIRQGIPYRIVGGVKFYERKEIKDVLAYLKLTANHLDSVSQERAIKLGKRRFARFQEWLDNQAIDQSQEPPFTTLEKILNTTAYLERLDSQDPQDAARLENIQELLSVASQFNTATSFLENIALVQDGYMHDLPDSNQPNVVTLMSLHSAKGLEFPIIFMVGMEEGLLPHIHSTWEKDKIEEERRLCYVGITRAKQKLYFTYARKRWQHGRTMNTTRSRFLSEIPTYLLDENKSDVEGSKSHQLKQDIYELQKLNRNKSSRKFSYPQSKKRKVMIDDDSLDALLNDELDINEFLDS